MSRTHSTNFKLNNNLNRVWLIYAVRQRFIMKKYSFKAIIDGKEFFPKGFYYQGKFIILVGCEKSNHTIRRKEKIEDVEIFVKN